MIGKRINLVLFKPDLPRFKILDCHLEIIESLMWGFKNLGFECTFRTNEVDYGCINIIFGWIVAIQLMQHGEEFPEGTIIYNFEQYSTESMRGKHLLEQVAEKYQIWDYSIGNVIRWKEMNPKFDPYYARVSFAPNLMKIPRTEKEDIDVAYIGSHGLKRISKLMSCAGTLNRNAIVNMTNIWGELRDGFISRSKILLNLSEENPAMNIFEIVRVSYYLANKKAVLCDFVPGLEIEDDVRKVLKFVKPQDFGKFCDNLIQDSTARKDYAEECFEIFRQRDIRNVIKDFF